MDPHLWFSPSLLSVASVAPWTLESVHSGPAVRLRPPKNSSVFSFFPARKHHSVCRHVTYDLSRLQCSLQFLLRWFTEFCCPCCCHWTTACRGSIRWGVTIHLLLNHFCKNTFVSEASSPVWWEKVKHTWTELQTWIYYLLFLLWLHLPLCFVFIDATSCGTHPWARQGSLAARELPNPLQPSNMSCIKPGIIFLFLSAWYCSSKWTRHHLPSPDTLFLHEEG